jgi:hypothetical protein
MNEIAQTHEMDAAAVEEWLARTFPLLAERIVANPRMPRAASWRGGWD